MGIHQFQEKKDLLTLFLLFSLIIVVFAVLKFYDIKTSKIELLGKALLDNVLRH